MAVPGFHIGNSEGSEVDSGVSLLRFILITVSKRLELTQNRACDRFWVNNHSDFGAYKKKKEELNTNQSAHVRLPSLQQNSSATGSQCPVPYLIVDAVSRLISTTALEWRDVLGGP